MQYISVSNWRAKVPDTYNDYPGDARLSVELREAENGGRRVVVHMEERCVCKT